LLGKIAFLKVGLQNTQPGVKLLEVLPRHLDSGNVVGVVIGSPASRR
jgi:hypothetical protein